MLSRQQRLKEKIASIQEKISRLPAGKLICTRNGDRIKWYHSDGHILTYLPKKQRKLAEQLAAKKYLTLLAEDLLREQKAIDSYLRHLPTDTGDSDQLLLGGSGYAELLTPFFKTKSQELSDWMNEPYECNEKYPEQLIHKTATGIFVRSKSESMIAMWLYTNGIPFRYECALHLGEITVFPDFTIRHPQTGHVYYWEHFGMMDQSAYCKSAISKMELYTSNKIYPSIQLLTTFETKENPLTSDIVEKMVEHYFL
ncbi:MAG: ATPase [Lachnospiraceae bacterium]|nr:ATPase [Lachnospiraceae bacterium]